MKFIKYFLLFLTILGIVNALYLTTVVYPESMTNPVSECDLCTFGNPEIWSCSSVARSPDSRIFGIYYPFIALAVYPLLAVLIIASLFDHKRKIFLVTGTLGALGSIMNLYFLYLEYAHIHKYCSLCLICLGTILTITALSFILYRRS